MSPVVVPGVSVQFSVLNVASERRFIGFRLGSRDVRREDNKMPEILKENRAFYSGFRTAGSSYSASFRDFQDADSEGDAETLGVCDLEFSTMDLLLTFSVTNPAISPKVASPPLS